MAHYSCVDDVAFALLSFERASRSRKPRERAGAPRRVAALSRRALWMCTDVHTMGSGHARRVGQPKSRGELAEARR